MLCERTCFCLLIYHLLSAFYETLPSKSPSKNRVFTDNPYRRLLRSVLLHDPLGVHPILVGRRRFEGSQEKGKSGQNRLVARFKGRKNNKLYTFCGRKWPVWDSLFDPPKSPRKSSCGSFFGVLSQETRHINFFLGAQSGCFGWGPKSLF